MPPPSAFLRRLRLVWVGLNLAILLVSASGYRDLSDLLFMLSFPADVVVGVILLPVLDVMTWSGPPWLRHLLFGSVVLASGYIQWFVIGRAVAERVSARFPSGRVLVVARCGAVGVLLGFTFPGLAMVRAQDEANEYRERAMTIRVGMSTDEARTILGDPNVDEARATESARLCPAGTARVRSYWYEHDWLPRRLSRDTFFLPVCLDRQGKVVHVGLGHAH